MSLFHRFFHNKDLNKLTLENIEHAMVQNEFDRGLIRELIIVFKKRVNQDGDERFRRWFSELHYQLPKEFESEAAAEQLYNMHSGWIESETKKLERETKLSWEEQTEDIKHLSVRARKAQLVVRHRLTDIYWDLLG
ncbi:MAG TPA: hypothetical protein VIG80_06850 [Bacillaceae bacterium]